MGIRFIDYRCHNCGTTLVDFSSQCYVCRVDLGHQCNSLRFTLNVFDLGLVRAGAIFPWNNWSKRSQEFQRIAISLDTNLKPFYSEWTRVNDWNSILGSCDAEWVYFYNGWLRKWLLVSVPIVLARRVDNPFIL